MIRQAVGEAKPPACCILLYRPAPKQSALEARRGEDVKTYEQVASSERQDEMWRAVECALVRYDLEGARVSLDGMESGLFSVEVPADQGRRVHPYLGRIDGKRFILSMHTGGTQGKAWAQAELEWLLALLRETEAEVPEPVPACDGSLVARIPVSKGRGAAYCLLLRWASDPLLDPSARLNAAFESEQHDWLHSYGQIYPQRRPGVVWEHALMRMAMGGNRGY
jgi:hypothetical protein